MRLKIDTDNKTIEIDGTVKIDELVKFLKDSIKDWQKYSIQGVSYTYTYPTITNPIIYQDLKPYYGDTYKVTCSAASGTYLVNTN